MEDHKNAFLDILIEIKGKRPIKVSLPNQDVSASDIVWGFIKKGFLDEKKRYRIGHILDQEQEIYRIVQGDCDTFVILDDVSKEDVAEEEYKMAIDSKKIFVVHGHERGLRDTVARFLEKLGAKPIILDEEPNLGMTIIEKIEKYSDVGFAVVLMTGDDRGGKKEDTYEGQKLRARQNVIFELGYFLSKLKRGRVCVIYESGVEIPSDYSGVLYIEHDSSDGWQIKLARELKASGLDINLDGLVLRKDS